MCTHFGMIPIANMLYYFFESRRYSR